jgi:hypothetical protein
VQILNGGNRKLDGSERTVISDLLELIKSHDPDLILLPMLTPGSRSWFVRRGDMVWNLLSVVLAGPSLLIQRILIDLTRLGYILM